MVGRVASGGPHAGLQCWWGDFPGRPGMQSPAGESHLGGSPQGGGRLEGLPSAPPLSLRPAFRGRRGEGPMEG